LFKNGHIKLGNLGEPRNIKELVVGAQNSIWAYMSPEMLTKNNDEINEKTDIWYLKKLRIYPYFYSETRKHLVYPYQEFESETLRISKPNF